MSKQPKNWTSFRFMLRVLLGLGYCSFPIPSMAETYNQSSALFRYLLDENRYNPEIRPMLNQAEPLVVQVAVSLQSVISLDDVSQQFVVHMLAVLWWIDELLYWDRDMFGGIIEIKLPQERIWKPSFTLRNTLKVSDPFKDDNGHAVINQKNKFVVWQVSRVLETSCALDVRNYPFDQQTCEISACTFGEKEDDVELLAYYTASNPTSAEWYAVKGEARTTRIQLFESDYHVPCVNFSYTLRRKSSVVIYTIILPVILLSTINVLVFIIPIESGEKISFAVTVLLALSLFLSLISNMLPRSSVPMITIYLLILLVVSVMSVVLTILIVALYQVGQRSSNDHEGNGKSTTSLSQLSDKDGASNSDQSMDKGGCSQRIDKYKSIAKTMNIVCFLLSSGLVLGATVWYFINVTQ